MGKYIVKYHKCILALVAVLLIPTLIGFFNTRVNYDMLNYLPDSMETVIGQKELLDNFHKGAFSMIITEGASDSEIGQLETELKTIDHVDTVLSLGTLENAGLPAEILPDHIYDTFRNGDESLIAIFFDTSSSADETIAAIGNIRSTLNHRGYVSGASAMVTDLRNLSESEEPIYIAVAVILALTVMLILLDNWLIPFIFLTSIGIMILFNMGTNFMFGNISYITKALAAILQLAVTMDYSIFLWHSYREHLAEHKDHSEKSRHLAMATAIKATFTSVIGSSATTIAGFIALCFMTFTLGLDLGLVMAKGVLLGVIGSVTVLPTLILIFGHKLEKFDHRSIMPSFNWLSLRIVKFFPIFLIAFVAIIPPFLYGYQKTNESVYYSIADSMPSDMEFAIANKKLTENFGLANVHMILTSADLPTDQILALTKDLEHTAGVKSVLSLEALTNGQAPTDILPSSITDILKSDKWELTLVVSEYHNATDEIATQINDIKTIIKSYDDQALLVGESSLTQDMIDLTSTDFQVVNTISIIAIFIIIAIATGSLSLPFILITVIESAIFINLGLPFYTGNQLSFITPICISTIQLGATIDYTILLTTRYKRERLAGHDKKESARIAIRTSIPSILVSGLGLFAATFGVSLYSNADMISSICMLLARGALISIVIVPTILPSLLILADPLVIRTTIGMKKLTKGTIQ